MDILLFGNTAREHALAWKFAESRRTRSITCTSPYSGITTLADPLPKGMTADDWCAAHPDGIVVDDGTTCLYLNPLPCPKDAIHIVVCCLTDGETILPLPAVRLHIEDGDVIAAEAPAAAYTPDLAQYAFQHFFLPQIHGGSTSKDTRCGILRFEMALTAHEPLLLSVHQGFGEPDAMTLLPLLRGELAELLLSCKNGTLGKITLRLHELFCAIRLLTPREESTSIHGLADIPTNIGVFMGAVQYQYNRMIVAGPRPLYLCARGKDPASAYTAIDEAAQKITFS